MDEYRKALTVWYYHNKRELPWRESRDPFKIWVSEVILQQTRVKQGLAYYHEFIRTFPDIKSLANAPEEEVLKVWQGLGYYSRARNMHHAAKTIMNVHGGIFPSDYSSIRNLKGIGDYSAAAIASLAFNLPYAVVDGNVFRVLSRLFGISTTINSSGGKKEFSNLAQDLLDTSQPGEFNQALMEFGAIQCVPGQPDCQNCPLSLKCYAYTNQLVTKLPVKSNQTKQKERFLNYLFVRRENGILLGKRADKDIWRNMYQFPLIETPAPATPEMIIQSNDWMELFPEGTCRLDAVSPETIHLLTHQRLHIRFFSITLIADRVPNGLILVDKNEVTTFPVPKPIENFLKESGY